MTSEVPLIRLLVVVDGVSEEIKQLIELTNFDLAAFCKHFHVDAQRDPDMTERYSVGPDDEDFVQKALSRPIVCNFRANAYFIEAALRDSESDGTDQDLH